MAKAKKEDVELELEVSKEPLAYEGKKEIQIQVFQDCIIWIGSPSGRPQAIFLPKMQYRLITPDQFKKVKELNVQYKVFE